MKSGIYKLTNLINGKFYIGKSLDVESRKYSHYYTLRRNKHGNAYLQRAWNKYGEDNFEFSILEKEKKRKKKSLFFTEIVVERETYK